MEKREILLKVVEVVVERKKVMGVGQKGEKVGVGQKEEKVGFE